MNNYSWFIGIITAWKGPLLNPTTFGSLPSSKIVEPSVMPNAISNDDSAVTKLSKENLELIGIIQSNDRLSDKLCPELVKLD